MAALHPQVVHFTIVLAIIGVAFRLVSLLGKPAFASPAATTLLLLAAVSSVVSVRSGTAAHGPVERVPGARPAVMEHEEWGERTQTALLILGAISLGLVMRDRQRSGWCTPGRLRGLRPSSASTKRANTAANWCTPMPAASASDPGDTKDVERLLLAGYYHQALADRKAGRADQAAALIPPLPRATRRIRGGCPAESMLRDQKNAKGRSTRSRPSTCRRQSLHGVSGATLQADAFEALGQKERRHPPSSPWSIRFPIPDCNSEPTPDERPTKEWVSGRSVRIYLLFHPS